MQVSTNEEKIVILRKAIKCLERMLARFIERELEGSNTSTWSTFNLWQNMLREYKERLRELEYHNRKEQ